ncbi:MAG: hypothetical protein IPH31_23380 [Lewinellaceae bacterium]|nr:hypothetical protein [Lewinellaceae bacterium]
MRDLKVNMARLATIVSGILGGRRPKHQSSALYGPGGCNGGASGNWRGRNALSDFGQMLALSE